jgi:DNA replication protein DnaC
MMTDFQKENSLPQGAISMNKLDICREAIKARFTGERKENSMLRFQFPFEYEEYKLLLSDSANNILEKRREQNSFIVDDKNKSIIEQLYLYLTLNKQFSGDLQKGIMLVGKYGCGKTLIMQAMAEMYNSVIYALHIQRPLLKFFKSSELQEILKGKPIKAYSRMPLVIDEFGREQKQIMDFGNLRSPMIELLCERYDTGAWTHGTSNFTLDTLCTENQYGKMTGDRLKSMFNFIELKGDSRRK